MTWSTSPPLLSRPPWSPTAPALPAQGGWTPVIVRTVHGHELAVATDHGITRLGVLTGLDLAVALDSGVTVLPGMVGSESAVSDEWGILTVRASGSELAVTNDRGTLGGWWRTETAIATDYGLIIPGALAGREPAAAADYGIVAAGGQGSELAVASDSGQGWFAWQESVLHALTTVGSHTVQIPVWARWIDLICLGGGGGGANGNQANQEGYGGAGGVWSATTLDRGEGRNTWTQVTCTVGGGGGSQSNGTASTATVAGVTTVTGAGGAGTSQRGSFLGDARNGGAPQGGSGIAPNYAWLHYQGYVYECGGPSTGDTANVPGSGGRGGGGATWPFQPGSGRPGARGQVWIRFRY